MTATYRFVRLMRVWWKNAESDDERWAVKETIGAFAEAVWDANIIGKNWEDEYSVLLNMIISDKPPRPRLLPPIPKCPRQ